MRRIQGSPRNVSPRYRAWREDIPRLPYRLPRPISPEQDHLLHQEFHRRNDPGENVFLLIHNTGMRIGECAAAWRSNISASRRSTKVTPSLGSNVYRI